MVLSEWRGPSCVGLSTGTQPWSAETGGLQSWQCRVSTRVQALVSRVGWVRRLALHLKAQFGTFCLSHGGRKGGS